MKLTGNHQPIFRGESEKKSFPWGKIIYLSILGFVIIAIVTWVWTKIRYIEAPGLVQAREFLVQSAETGRIETIAANIGDHVTPDMELARVNVTKRGQDQWNPEMIYQIKASMEKISGQAEVASKELSLKSGLVNSLATERIRTKRLLEQRVIKYSDYKKIDLECQTLQAEAGRLRSLVNALDKEKETLNDIYRQYLPPGGKVFVSINSPAAGIVINRERQPGDVVLVGQPILTLIDPNEIFIKAFIDEKFLMDINLGEPAKIIFKDGSIYPGKVVKFYPGSDSLPPEYQRYYMTRQKAIVAEIKPDCLDSKQLKYGMVVKVRFANNMLNFKY
jgi:multidrug resistance efflux pump